MTKITAKYLGDLRVECHHDQSGTTLITDAPIDNNGKGQSFSPTDLVATALASCATTIMGMYAATRNINIAGMTIDVTKTMAPDPRRISQIDVVFTMPSIEYSAKDKLGLERAAYSCPVHASLHPDMSQNLIFKWPA